MSRQEDNINNKKLKDLLNKKKRDESSMDDFEREALEGFDMLENEQEALDLKENLDKKIYGEVLSPKKNNVRYWFAAAGLVLVIGLAVIFTLNNTQPQSLAIHDTETKNKDLPEKAVEQSIAHQEVLKPAPEAFSKQHQREFETGSGAAAGPAEKAKGKSGYRSDDVAQDEAADMESAAPAAPAEIPVTSTNAGLLTGAIASNAVASGTGHKTAKDVVPAEPLAFNEKQEPKPEDKKNSKEDVAIDSKPLTEIAVAEEAKMKKSHERKKAAYSSESSQPAKQAAPVVTGDYSRESNSDLANTYTLADSITIMNADQTLYKNVKERLQQEKICGKFDAVLFVDQNGKVVKAVIDNPRDLNKKEVKQVTGILESLKDIAVHKDSKAGIIQYRINYREMTK